MVTTQEPSKMRQASGDPLLRPPAVAGSFYPADPDRLRSQVSGLLAGAPATAGLTPKALIAPHAGYAYSGRVAAAAFATLRDCAAAKRRVVLIGPAHYVAVRGIAAPAAEVLATPLGRVGVDAQGLREIADLPCVVRSDVAHASEHSLEVELPFLQMLLPSFAVVPLVVGEASPQEVAQVLGRLWGGSETLLVVSSDLSHYQDYETTQQLDAATAAAIEHGDWSRLGPDEACGWLAVAGLLLEAGRRGLKALRLALCNSGDTAGSRQRVVGYGAWMLPHAVP
jgi:AmmeMemoRadiSam system protein B